MLYNDTRPKTFDEVKGQEQVVQNFKVQSMQDRFMSNYILYGQHGAGKTTIGRILAKAVNCKHKDANGNPCLVCETCQAIENSTTVDFIELNAADNNSVEDVRGIIESSQYAPVSMDYKVFIIDEVHMLSTSAFNALLKLFEEPPKYIKFILCTTERKKIPATILSRAAQYQIKRISDTVIQEHITEVAKRYDYILELDAAILIAKYAYGAMRDALSILEQCMGKEKTITQEYVKGLLGIENISVCFEMIEKLNKKDFIGIISIIEKITAEAKDISLIVNDMLEIISNVVVYKNTNKIESISNTENYKTLLQNLASQVTLERMFYFSDELLKARDIFKRDKDKGTTIVQFIRIARHIDVTYEGIIERLEKLENRPVQQVVQAVAVQGSIESEKESNIAKQNCSNENSNHGNQHESNESGVSVNESNTSITVDKSLNQPRTTEQFAQEKDILEDTHTSTIITEEELEQIHESSFDLQHMGNEDYADFDDMDLPPIDIPMDMEDSYNSNQLSYEVEKSIEPLPTQNNVSTASEIQENGTVSESSNYDECGEFDDMDLPQIDIPLDTEERTENFQFTQSTEETPIAPIPKQNEEVDIASVSQDDVSAAEPVNNNDGLSLGIDGFEDFFEMNSMFTTFTDEQPSPKEETTTQVKEEKQVTSLKKQFLSIADEDEVIKSCLEGCVIREENNSLMVYSPLKEMIDIINSYKEAYELDYLNAIYDNKIRL